MMWGVKGSPFIKTPELWDRDALPFSAIPGLGATEVEEEGARPLSPLWALLWACPLGRQGAFAGMRCWYISPDWNAAILPEAMRALAVQAGSATLRAPNCGSGKNP